MEKLSLNATPEELAEMDFSELHDKTLPWEYDDGSVISGRVIGVDYNIGLTIVNADNPKHNLTCGNGPLSTIPDAHPETYTEWFICAVNMILKGYYRSLLSTKVELALATERPLARLTSMYQCAFNQ